MEFSAHCKRKRFNYLSNCNNNGPILPEAGCQYHGIYTGLTVEVKDAHQIKSLYDSGCFGKGSNSRGGPTEEGESLWLGLEEACFLAYYLEALQIKDLEGKELKWEDFLKDATSLNERFVDQLAAYLYLKAKNWVIKSGIKFGGDFLIYKQSPRNFHASFLVLIKRPTDQDYHLAKNLKGVQRVAETSDKDVLLMQVTQPTGFEATSKESLQLLTIKETVIRRFNYSSFVTNK